MNQNNTNNTNNTNTRYEIEKENEIEALTRMRRLPIEMIDTIDSYMNSHVFAFTNKTNYENYHPCIKPIIMKAKKFENYVRDMIRRDNAFVLDYILKENCVKWYNDYTYYVYKNITYKNYIYFLLDFCIEHDSTKCRSMINKHLDELGLTKKST